VMGWKHGHDGQNRFVRTHGGNGAGRGRPLPQALSSIPKSSVPGSQSRDPILMAVISNRPRSSTPAKSPSRRNRWTVTLSPTRTFPEA
jgi:hypothetical protein